MSIYKEHYVYRITNIFEGRHYYGSRTSKNGLTAKEELGFKYFSSSKLKSFQEDQKINPTNYKYKVIRIFDDRVKANSFECLLHERFQVHKNKKFYNMAKSVLTDEGFEYFPQKLQSFIREEHFKKYGVKTPFERKEIRDQCSETFKERTGFENPFQDETVKGIIRKTNLIKYGFENPSQSKEIKDKKRKTFISNFGTNFLFVYDNCGILQFICEQCSFIKFCSFNNLPRTEFSYALEHNTTLYQRGFGKGINEKYRHYENFIGWKIEKKLVKNLEFPEDTLSN